MAMSVFGYRSVFGNCSVFAVSIGAVLSYEWADDLVSLLLFISHNVCAANR